MVRKAKGILLLLAAVLLLAGCGEKAKEPVNLQGVYDGIAAQIDLPQMAAQSENRMQKYYGIDVTACPQAIAMVNEASMSVDEIWLIEAPDEEEAKRIEEVARSRITQLCAETQQYSPELYAVASEGQTLREGCYVGLFISPDAAAMAKSFREALGN